MNYLQSQQMWEGAQARHAELLKESQKVRLAKMAAKITVQPKQSWWKHLLRRQTQEPMLVFNPKAAPEPR